MTKRPLLQLKDIAPEAYARDVLPLTASIWAGRRDLETYVSQVLAVARSGYGRRHYRTVGLFEGSVTVASFKRYERVVHDGPRRLHALGIGAVFTPEEFRGRGYASVMLGHALDRAKADGYDLAYLFSDIRPQFYEPLGFRTLASRELSLRADTLGKRRLEVVRLEDSDWSGVRRCFELCSKLQPYGFTRTPLVWEWLRLRMAQFTEHKYGAQVNLVARRGRAIAAYVLGARVPERDCYEVDEYGFADAEAAELIPALLRAAAGDLRRIVGWLPPAGARELLPRGSVRKRKSSVLMAAPLSSEGAKLLTAAAAPAVADFCWTMDHV
jgi:GNAT superfamily N-acetyltransferase